MLEVTLGLDGYSPAVFVIDAILVVVFVGTSRLSMRLLGELLRPSFGFTRRVIVYGAGDEAVLVCRGLLNDPALARSVVGFVDDDPTKHKRRILGVPVLGGSDRLGDILRAAQVDEVVVSSPGMAPASLQRLAAECEALGVSLSHAALHIE